MTEDQIKEKFKELDDKADKLAQQIADKVDSKVKAVGARRPWTLAAYTAVVVVAIGATLYAFL